MRTEATIHTQIANSAPLYMKKLCRHFGHKVPVNITDDQGIIEFPFGRCHITTTDQSLHMAINVSREEDLERAQSVVGDHLQRMAPKETLQIHWAQSAA